MSTQEQTPPKSINPLALGADDLLAQPSQGYWAEIWKEVKKRPTARIAIWVLIFLALVSILAPVLTNHRPLVSTTPITAEDGTVSKVLAFPLFKSLGIVDWTLISMMISIVWLVVWRKFILNNKGKSNPLILTAFVIFALVPIAWGLYEVPWSMKTSIPGALWWSIFGVVGFIGLLALSSGTRVIATGKRDEFGRDMTGSALRKLLIGSLMLVIAGAAFGTLNRPKLDRTDYYKEFVLAPDDGAWALFAPLPHDYLASQPYTSSQPPLSPVLRVMPSGGSAAAADLSLDDKSREDEITLASHYNGTLSVDTPLSVLNNGDGVELHKRGSNDIIIVNSNLKTTRIKLKGATTLGDVIDKINAKAIDTRTKEKRFNATLNPAVGIVIEDLMQSRPVHLMGTESSGADTAGRLVMATRVALSIGFVSTGIAVIIGVTFGAIIGYFGGWVDFIGMRIIEIFMAIPRLFLLLTIIAFLPAKWSPYMLYAMMVVIGLTSWMSAARFIRAEFFRLRETDYVQAAKACGLPLRSILFKHMLPNGVTAVLVSASFGVAAAIFVETGLSFLGFGIKPPHPSWGQMLNEAIDPDTGVFRWWLAIFPGIMIFLTVFAFNLLGDALRDAIDPKLKKAPVV